MLPFLVFVAALVVVGDGAGRVGLGYGKAREVPLAIQKGTEDAKKNLFEVPLAGTTIIHPVLGVYGGLDARVNATRDAATAALVAARLKHEILTFTQADHAFFNDARPEVYNAEASLEAWERTLALFREQLTPQP